MKSSDGINYDFEAGDIVQHITKDEILNADMFVRARFEDASDSGGFNATWKAEGWRGTHWHKLETEMPAWAGKTYYEYEDFCKNQYGDAEEDYFIFDIVKVL